MKCPLCTHCFQGTENRYLHVKRCGSQQGLTTAQILSVWNKTRNPTTPGSERTVRPVNSEPFPLSPVLVATDLCSPRKRRQALLNKSLIEPIHSSRSSPSSQRSLVPWFNEYDHSTQSSSQTTDCFCSKCGGSFTTAEMTEVSRLNETFEQDKRALQLEFDQKLSALQDQLSTSIHQVHRTRSQICVQLVSSPTRNERKRHPFTILGSGKIQKSSSDLGKNNQSIKINSQKLRRLTDAEEHFLCHEFQNNDKLIDIWISMLLFETISVDFLIKTLRELGFSYSKGALCSFLDKQGVIFRSELVE
ncbi:hypothetical protein GEMRC1_008574 [Eukaryota sp. GEM-RC1]